MKGIISNLLSYDTIVTIVGIDIIFISISNNRRGGEHSRNLDVSIKTCCPVDRYDLPNYIFEQIE